MGPVCLHCGQMGAMGNPSLGIPRQVDQPCEREGCDGHYRLLTHEEELELRAAWKIDGLFKSHKLWRADRHDDELAVKLTLLTIRRGRTNVKARFRRDGGRT